MNQKILAIDPGTEESAWVIWDGERILNMGLEGNDDVRGMVSVADDKPLVIEMIQSFGMAVGQSVFETVFWIGRFYEAHRCIEYGRYRLFRKDVKMHLCQSMRAKDSNIIQALKDRFEPDLKPRCRPKGVLKGVKADIWQALALAVTWWDAEKS